MHYISDGIIFVLGQIMLFCYNLVGNYGLSIILFTLITKVFLIPLNLLVQKNSIKMVNLMPEQNALKIKYVDDKDKYTDEQIALYKRHKYNPMLGVVPLLIQIPLILGLVGVIYRPLSYAIGFSSDVVSDLTSVYMSNNGITEATSRIQIDIINAVQNSPFNYNGTHLEEYLREISAFKINFLGLDLSMIPSFKGNYELLIIPVLSGLSAWFLCVMQNKINVLQLTQGKGYKLATTIFMVAFSSYFSFVVPAGVGLYWIFGNLFAVPVMLIVNAIIPPKKHVDYDYLVRMNEEKAKHDAKMKANLHREKADYKKFFEVKDMQLMVYSEANGFYKYFKGIIDYICENSDIDIHYVTSDPNDNIFKDERKNIHPYYVASDKYLIPLFMKLDTDICLLTTPDIEKYQLKRSRVRKDVEYIYMNHAMGSVNLNLRKGALNYFDTIFCIGPDYVEEIRAIEALYGSPKKVLVETGYPLLDEMLEKYNSEAHSNHEIPRILVAPSWQPDNIFETCIDGILESLKGTNYEINLRPHPQHVRHAPELFEGLKDKYEYEGSNITVTTDFSATNPVLEADILITDWSDIAWEYAFTTKRPVLFIDTPMKMMNPDYEKIGITPRNIKLRDVVGRRVKPEETKDKVATEIKYMLEHYSEYNDAITKTHQDYTFNIGKSKILCGKYILKRLKN
ncbi:MAG: membrane protein insertase YidC [Clostridia bacterium]|nr:membrane protein insertase YidC [Clostridia bacterium]